MKQSTALIFAGAGLGFFVGSSMGVATGGTAYNAAIFLAPLGAFVGWLLSSKSDSISDQANEGPEPDAIEPINKPRGSIEILVHSVLAILASIWNFHIELLRVLGLLGTFVRQPLLFLGLCVVVSVFFPPFILIYFCAWLGASHFGLSKENQYRATVK